MRTKTSPIWQIDGTELKTVITESNSFKAVLVHFKLRPSPGNRYTLHKRLKEDRIDISSLYLKQKLVRNQWAKAVNSKATPIENMLVENSSTSRDHLKKRLLSSKMLENKCAKCGLGTEWNGERLSIQIDHINGINNDNRLENLRMLCPNCHSQTETFGRKNKKVTYKCDTCGEERKWKYGKLCKSCHVKKLVAIRQNNRPQFSDIDEVFNYVCKFGYESAGRKYNMTGTGIKQRLKRAGLDMSKKSYPMEIDISKTINGSPHEVTNSAE